VEEFAKTLRAKQMWLSGGMLTIVAVAVVTRLVVRPAGRWADFIAGFQVGVALGVVGFMAFHVVRYSLARRDPVRLQRLQAAARDERTLLIHQSAGSTGVAVVVFAFAGATVVAGNFNATVFFTLMAATVFVGLVVVAFKVYYAHRY